MLNTPLRTTTNTYPSMRLRHATEYDIPVLNALITDSLRALGTEFYTRQQIESALKYGVMVEPLLVRDGTFYVVEYGKKIIASGAWSRWNAMHQGMPNTPLNAATDAAKVRSFYVHPNWTRRGLGSWLMGECISAARAAGFRQLELLATRMGEPLYLKFGFQVIEEVQATMPDGVSFSVKRMVKDLA